MIYRTQEAYYGKYIDRVTLNKDISEGNLPLSCDKCNFLVGYTI